VKKYKNKTNENKEKIEWKAKQLTKTNKKVKTQKKSVHL
jgi:hypothetical protein